MMTNPEKSPQFSIIIPAFNVADFLPACLDSVLTQAFTDYEIILIDDGSTDSTGQICDEHQNDHITVIHQQNAGLSAARNAGVKKATGEYLLFLDGDDLLAPSALANISTALASYSVPPDLLRYQCQDLHTDGSTLPRPEPSFAPLPGPAAFPLLAHCHYTENAWLYCYRREFFQANHFAYAKGRLAEDFGLTPLIIARATSVAAISDICYSYRTRPGSIMHDPAKLRKRVADSFAGLVYQLPLLDAINSQTTAPISHYLCVSFLTLASQLPMPDYLDFYRQFTRAGFQKYIKPQSLRSLPRAFLLRHAPRLYRLLFQPKA